MRRILLAVAAGIALLAAAAWTQAPPSVSLLVNRMSGAYRSLQSFSDSATIKRKVLKKDAPAALTLAMQKPNKFLIELKGDYLNTLIVSDGTSLVTSRPDRKVYTKARAPIQITRTDLIGEVDLPSPGARVIAQLLAGTGREGAVGQLLMNGKVSGPQKIGGRQCYTLTLPYGEEVEAQVLVGTDDYLIRQVKLVRGGEVEWQEDHETVLLDKPLTADTFNRPVPEGFKQVAALPALERPVEVASKDSEGGRSVDNAGADRKSLIAQGQSVFKSSGCTRCHSMGGQGGRIGPDLTHIGAGRTPEALIQFIKNPRVFNPSSRMPGFAGRINEENFRALGEFLGGLK